MNGPRPPHVEKRTRLALIVTVLGFGGFVSCKQATPTDDRPPHTPVAKEECEAKWMQLERSITLTNRSRAALAANQGTHYSSLRRQERQNQAVNLDQQIPMEDAHDHKALRLAIEQSSGDSAVVIRDVDISKASTAKRALPTETTKPFIWTQDDVLTSYDVQFFVESLTARRFADWYKKLPMRLERILIVDSAKQLPGGHQVTGSVYSFRNVVPPVHGISSVSLIELMKSHGINEDVCTPSPGRLTRLEAKIAKTEKMNVAAQDTLTRLAQVRLAGFRFKTFERVRTLRAQRALKTIVVP